MKTKIKAFIGLLLFTCIVFQFSCKKNDDNPATPSAQAKVTASVAGKITDEAGSPVVGAIVTMEGSTATSNLFGLFVFKNVLIPKERSTLKVSQAGFADQYVGFRPSAKNIKYLHVTMLKPVNTAIINSKNGGTASLPSGASVAFPPDAFMMANGTPYNGDVTVSLMYLNADDEDFIVKSPGQDMHALDTDGNMKMLLSYGMMDVELRSVGGALLQLAAGKSAALAFPVSSKQSAMAPSSIPLWYFDIEKNIWREEGSAIKNGAFYLGTVKHFTWWNCDQSTGIATLQTSTISCDGVTYAGNVTVRANSYMAPAYTSDSQGQINDDAPASLSSGAFSIRAVTGNTVISQVISIPVLSVGQVYQAPALILQNGTASQPMIKGTLVDCNNQPTDGFIVYTNQQTNTWSYQYVDGDFSAMVDINADYKITALSKGKYGQVMVDAMQGTCQTTDLGNVTVCSTVTTGNANFNLTITSPILGTQTAGYFIDSCQVSFQPGGYYDISLSGVDTANGSFGFMVMSSASYAPGNYNWDSNMNKIYFSANINGIPLIISGHVPGINSLIATPAPGGTVEAEFSGNVNITSTTMPGIIVPGTLTGKFSVVRTF